MTIDRGVTITFMSSSDPAHLTAYVTVHDAALVAACEAAGPFASLDIVYLFVGARTPPDGVDLVVARDHSPNYEHWPQFYDFTGWYVLAHHGLLRTDRLVTLQYDMTVTDPTLPERVLALLDAGPGPVAFVAGHYSARNWMLALSGFAETFNSGMAVKGVDPNAFPPFEEWPSTQGMAWRRDDFEEFMAWFEPLFPVWADNVWAGHLAERSVWAWMMATGRPARFLPNMVRHDHGDVHGTCALMAGRADVHAAKAATFGRVVDCAPTANPV